MLPREGVINIKGIVITTNNEMFIQDFEPPLHESIGAVVDGWIEIVHPRRLALPYCMVVNEEGLLRNLDVNRFGSYLYETDKHGSPIVGNIVILKEHDTFEGRDLEGLSDKEIAKLTNVIAATGDGIVRWRKEQ